MPTIWFILVVFMIIAYVVLDGFDIGSGVLHMVIARTDEERRVVLRAIGPVWDGNEVWIIAGGGTLFLAFPLLYASSFSGFYLPLMVLLWLLVGRGISIEFRTHLESPIWTSFFDGVFLLSSALLAVFYGAAFANVVRGVPLNAEHFFFEPLWTNFRVGPNPGILDWYTCVAAVLALAALSMHGALFLNLKTEGKIQDRARWLAVWMWLFVMVLTILEGLGSVILVRPALETNYLRYPVWFVVPFIAVAALLLVPYFLSRSKESAALYASGAYLAVMVGGAAVALYPTVLPASGNPQYSLTIYEAAAAPESLRLALYWWLPGIAVAITYFIFMYRMFRGKATASNGYGPTR
jgi:cytochrome bd ubiquinol oxidase subunit II